MKLTLNRKIVAPVVVLGVLVVVAVAVMLGMYVRKEINANDERARMLQVVLAGTHEVADHVKSGILTRDDSSAVDTAKAALDVDARLATFGAGGADLRQQFEGYYVSMVAVNSIFLENRNAEGEKRLDQLKEHGRRIDEAIQTRIKEVIAERDRFATIARAVQIVIMLVIAATLVLVAAIFLVPSKR